MFLPEQLFDLEQTQFPDLFDGLAYAWEAIPRIKDYIKKTLKPALHHVEDGRVYIGEDVYIGEGTVVEEGAMIKGPAIIGRNCQIRHNAYIRDHVIVGDDCVLGNACEFKNAFLFNGCTVPHFSYVGDSIFGYKAHLGAGVKISNIKLLPGNITVQWGERTIDTGLRKFGAILGDHTDVGCNTVMNPGTVLGPHAVIYPNTNWRGVLEPHKIAKNKGGIEIVQRRSV